MLENFGSSLNYVGWTISISEKVDYCETADSILGIQICWDSLDLFMYIYWSSSFLVLIELVLIMCNHRLFDHLFGCQKIQCYWKKTFLCILVLIQNFILKCDLLIEQYYIFYSISKFLSYYYKHKTKLNGILWKLSLIILIFKKYFNYFWAWKYFI